MAPIRGESLGTLYRTIVQEAEYSRRRDVRSERLGLIEQLGYVHRKKKVPPPGASGLGSLARSRRVPPPRASADVLADVKMWRERRRRSQFASTLADQLTAIQKLQIANEPVPQQLWLELDRAQRAPQMLPAVPTPGPGAYRKLHEATSMPEFSFGDTPDAARRAAEERAAPPGPGPGEYLKGMEDEGATRGEAHRFDLGPARLIKERSTYVPRKIKHPLEVVTESGVVTLPDETLDADEDDPFDTGSVGVVSPEDRARQREAAAANAASGRRRSSAATTNARKSQAAPAHDDAASQASAPTVQSEQSANNASVPSLAVQSFSTTDTTISAHTNAFKPVGGTTNLSPKKKRAPLKKQERTSAWRPGSVRRNY